jgi:ParB-like chromosome segregation protein Spo0J
MFMSKYQVMRDLTEREYAELRQSIMDNGVLQPIYFDTDGEILDGHHRMKVCDELGITDFPRMIVPGLTEEEKLNFAREVNVTRRHLTAEEKRIEAEHRLKEQPQLSDRQIGRQVGASNTFVSNLRKELVQAGELSTVDSSIGLDGKERPRNVPRSPVAVYNPTERTERALRDSAVVEHMVERGIGARKAQEELRRAEKAKRKDRPACNGWALHPDGSRFWSM